MQRSDEDQAFYDGVKESMQSINDILQSYDTPSCRVAASAKSLSELRKLNMTALLKHLNLIVEMTTPSVIADEVLQNWMANFVLEIE